MLFYEYQCVDCGRMDQRVAGGDDDTALCVNCGGLMRRLQKNQDNIFIEDWGRSMRFFLNLSFILICAFLIFIPFSGHWMTPVIMIIYLSIVITTILSFIAFLRNLKRTEKYATQERDIELVSRVIWEFNKSSLIRLAIGKTQTFIKEK